MPARGQKRGGAPTGETKSAASALAPTVTRKFMFVFAGRIVHRNESNSTSYKSSVHTVALSELFLKTTTLSMNGICKAVRSPIVERDDKGDRGSEKCAEHGGGQERVKRPKTQPTPQNGIQKSFISASRSVSVVEGCWSMVSRNALSCVIYFTVAIGV